MEPKNLEIAEKQVDLAIQFDTTTEGQTRELLLWLANLGRQKLLEDKQNSQRSVEIDPLISKSEACRILGVSLGTLKTYGDRYGLNVVNPSKAANAQRYSTKEVIQVRDLLDEREMNG